MRTIESDIHDILLDIAPDAHDLEDQARIVATAAVIFEKAESSFRKKTAGKDATHNPEKVREAQIVDAIFQAMNRLADWHSASDIEEAEYTETFVDARGLDPMQIVHKAANTVIGFRYSGMDIDNDLDDLFGEPAGLDPNKYFVDDDIHDPWLYQTPGMGKHRSDSRGR